MMADIKLFRNETQAVFNSMRRGQCMNHWDIHSAFQSYERGDPMEKTLRSKEEKMHARIMTYSSEEFSVADSKTCQFIAEHAIPHIGY